MPRPAITVVTVALNAATDLPLTIESVLGQSYPDIEYIVIDGLSHDSTHAALARYHDRVDRIISLEDGGIYQAMNFAADEARGEFILFLNAGDRLYGADTIEAMIERLDEEADIAYGDHVYVDGRQECLMRSADFDWIRRRLFHGQIDKAWHLRMPCHQSTLTSKALLRRLRYDTRYNICADHDFLLRASAAGARLQYINEIVAHYTAGGMSGAQGIVIHREWAHAYRKHSLRPKAVDRFFFGTDAESPFPTYTSASGLVLGGVHEEESAPHDPSKLWHWGSLVAVTAPMIAQSIGIAITGHGLFPDQILHLTCGDRLLGIETVGDGPFSIHCAFVEPLSPGEILMIAPAMVGPISQDDSREAGWGFEALEFIPCATPDQQDLNIAISNPELINAALVDGWWEIEPQPGYVWSANEQASIALAPAGRVSRLALECAGNPHVILDQILSVVINGKLAGKFHLDRDSTFTICDVDVARLWRQGANIIRLCIDEMSCAPGDTRRLGIALRRIVWS